MNSDPTATMPVTVAQSCALAERVRRGELTTAHRDMIAELLHEVGSSLRASARLVERHAYAGAVWEPVGAQYTHLIDAASRCPATPASASAQPSSPLINVQ